MSSKNKWAIRIKNTGYLQVTDFECTYDEMVKILKKQGHSLDDILSITIFA